MILALAGCVAPEYRADPTSAPSVVLLGQLAPGSVTIAGVLEGDSTIDVDRGADDRYGFRFRVIGRDGAVLVERATMGPALVLSFLDYWSEVSGIDILHTVPTLGRFPVVVPVLPEADEVVFQLRDDAGAWVDAGRWSYDALDDPRVEPTIEPVAVTPLWVASDPGVDPLDVVILSDGYTADELDRFASDADKVARSVLDVEPFRSYAPRMSITRVDVPSPQSGASFDCDTCGYVENAFGSIFPIELVNRLSGSTFDTRPMFQSDQWKVVEALAHVPWDAVIVLVNSDKFGGMAVHHASVTRGVGDIGPTAVHELGHSFGLLGDEYTGDACIRSPSFPLPENVTDHPEDPPWAPFVDPGAPLPTEPGSGVEVGAFQGAWNCDDLYRASEDCRMNEGHGPFCAACAELLTRRLLRFDDPAGEVWITDRRVRARAVLPDTEAVLVADGVEIGRGPVDALPPVPRGTSEAEVTLEWRPAEVRSHPTEEMRLDLQETWTFRPR